MRDITLLCTHMYTYCIHVIKLMNRDPSTCVKLYRLPSNLYEKGKCQLINDKCDLVKIINVI